MLQSLFLAAALTTMTLGAPTGDLQVALSSVSSSVKSIQDIIITATVSNPTDKDIRVLAINNILDPSLTQSFTVSKDSEEVKFTGVRAIFDMTAEGVYKVIPAGSSVSVNHTNIAPLYDFQSGGIGKFRFTAGPLYTAGATKSVATNPADVMVDVTDDVARRNFGDVNKSTPTCNNVQQYQFITRTLAEGLQLARAAAADITNRPTSAEFSRYFKTNNPATVRDMFTKIGNDASNRVVSCTDPRQQCGTPQGVIAYTLLGVNGNGNIFTSDIFTCPTFFTTQPTARICQTGYDATTSSDGGIMLHELSHANSATKDLGYGCRVTEGLPAASQINNADNFRCMGLVVYSLQNCRPKSPLLA